jgi:hypothetical protein
LLDAIEKEVPIGQIAWQNVMNYFNARVPDNRERDERSLRNKFNALVNMKAPTGDPNIPNQVLRAKELSERIIESSEMIDGSKMSDESGEVEGTDDEEDAEEVTAEEGAEGRLSKKPAAAASTNSSITSASSCQRRNKRKDRKNAASNVGLIEAFLETEKMHLKESRRRERRREKRENKNMKMFVGLMAGAMNAVATSNGGRAPIDAAFFQKMFDDGKDSSSSDDSSSMSSIGSRDSPPTKRLKLSKGKVDQKAQKEEAAKELEIPDL